MKTVVQTKIEESSDKSLEETHSVHTVESHPEKSGKENEKSLINNQEKLEVDGDKNGNFAEMRNFSVCCLIVAALHIYFLDIWDRDYSL